PRLPAPPLRQAGTALFSGSRSSAALSSSYSGPSVEPATPPPIAAPAPAEERVPRAPNPREPARGRETRIASAESPGKALREKRTEANRAELLAPVRPMAQPLIRSGAAAALSPELAEAYRALGTHGRALSREDFARARGLATEVAASHPGDREAVFL